MSIQLKKKTIAETNNAIDSDHINIFVDSADGGLKKKDEAGVVTSVASGVGSIDGQAGVITAADIKSIYESNSDTNELTDAEKTTINNIVNLPKNKLLSNIIHPGPDYNSIWEPITNLQIDLTANKNYMVIYHIIASQPATSASFDFSFWADPVEGDCYINGYCLRAGTPLQVADFYPTYQCQNTAGANRLNYYEINAVVECGAADSAIVFKFRIEGDDVAYVPTIHKGSYVTYEEV